MHYLEFVLSVTPVGGHVIRPSRSSAGGFAFGKSMKTAVLIDGGYLRVLCKQSGRAYNNDLIEKVAKSCIDSDENLLRVLYYDCAPYVGKAKLPVSGTIKNFEATDVWLRELATRQLFAVRRGVLKFRGFKPKKIPISSDTLTDDDFAPYFEQKGVDMRIGLDIAHFAQIKSIDRIILVSGDTDCIPAMKHARKSGLQVVLIQFPKQRIAEELLWHADIVRQLNWPVSPDRKA